MTPLKGPYRFRKVVEFQKVAYLYHPHIYIYIYIYIEAGAGCVQSPDFLVFPTLLGVLTDSTQVLLRESLPVAFLLQSYEITSCSALNSKVEYLRRPWAVGTFLRQNDSALKTYAAHLCRERGLLYRFQPNQLILWYKPDSGTTSRLST